jgi:hypothetical protein
VAKVILRRRPRRCQAVAGRGRENVVNNFAGITLTRRSRFAIINPSDKGGVDQTTKPSTVQTTTNIMKLIQGILGCALAAGLMTFASDNSHAAVIENTVFVPINIKLTVYYNASNGKIKAGTFVSKDVLKILNYPKGDQLALATGSSVDFSNGDVCIIDKNTLVEDLTAAGYMTDTLNSLVNSYTNKDNGSFKDASAGSFALDFYSDAGDDLDGGHDSEYWFELTGAYTGHASGSAIKGGKQRQNVSYNAKLDGEGHDADLTLDNLPVIGSTSVSGSGKVAVSP